MLDDLYVCAAALLDILVFARSGPPVDALIAFFTSRALTELDCETIEVRRGQPGTCTPNALDGSTKLYVSCHPVSCGRDPWGELHLTYLDVPLALSEIERGRLLSQRCSAQPSRAPAPTSPARRRPAGMPRRSRSGPRTRIPTR